MGRFQKQKSAVTVPAMADRHVIDTNVLIAASAATPPHVLAQDVTPSDPALLLRIWQWLSDFSDSQSHLVLDQAGSIAEEYQHQLGFNDFGVQVMMHKWSTAAVDAVEVLFDRDGNAILPPELMDSVHDVADRKFVAAALRAEQTLGPAPIVFAGDTDWHDWELTLQQTGIKLLPLIEEWSRARHKARQKSQTKGRHHYE